MLMSTARPLGELENTGEFIARHIGIDEAGEQHMLSVIGEASRRALIDSIVPRSIARSSAMLLPPPASEADALQELRAVAQKNQVFKSFIGQGYHGTHTPAVILRNVLENPAWYTAYTPYQAEISQGRMEALINFQTMVADLTAMEICNASLLDEATPRPAITLVRRTRRAKAIAARGLDCLPDQGHPYAARPLHRRGAGQLGAELYQLLEASLRCSGAVPAPAPYRDLRAEWTGCTATGRIHRGAPAGPSCWCPGEFGTTSWSSDAALRHAHGRAGRRASVMPDELSAPSGRLWA